MLPPVTDASTARTERGISVEKTFNCVPMLSRKEAMISLALLVRRSTIVSKMPSIVSFLYIFIEAGYHFVFVMHAGIRNAFLVAFELAVIDISAQVIILGRLDEIDVAEGQGPVDITELSKDFKKPLAIQR